MKGDSEVIREIEIKAVNIAKNGSFSWAFAIGRRLKKPKISGRTHK